MSLSPNNGFNETNVTEKRLDCAGDYSVPEKVKITMKNYVRDVLEGCSDMTGTAESPAQSNLFLFSLNMSVSQGIKKLGYTAISSTTTSRSKNINNRRLYMI